MSENFALKVEKVSKSFGPIKALDNVDFELMAGEIHALLGENGAGKSTLVKILAGIHPKDSGQIFINNEEVAITNPTIASKLGINVIHQDIKLVNGFTVGENIFLNHELNKNGVIKWSQIHKESAKILKKLGLNVDTHTLVEKLGIGERQIVQIAKAISLKVKILIMDEPTAALTETEAESLFALVKQLKSEGVSIIYISHRLGEVFAISDRITVLRDGKLIGTVKCEKDIAEQVIHMMIGRDIEDLYPTKDKTIGKVALELKDVSQRSNLENISLQLRSGEILGVAGLLGSGDKNLAYIIFGMEKFEKGSIFLEDKFTNIKNPAVAISKGIGLVPEDRKKLGLCPGLSVAENIIMSCFEAWGKLGFRKAKVANKYVNKFIKELSIKLSSPNALITSLSGGNQQKVVISKWLATRLKILVLHEPTFGVDIGARAEIYSIINNLAKSGVAVLLISSDMPEVLGMSDRIMCLYKGKITGVFNTDQVNENKVRALCSGLQI
jgi:ribose transport system ATP-binding protein